MANTIFITANWNTGALSQQTISRQYDNNRYAVRFVDYPEASDGNELDYYLLVWMSTAPGQKPGEITPIQLNSDQWYISNYFTQQVQVIKFQLCVLNEAGTYEAHSPIFSGRIGDSLEHDGTSQDIDVSTLFDAYREYLNELIIGAGAVIIDPVPTQSSTNAVRSGGVYDALHDTDTTLSQSGQAADAYETGQKIEGVRDDLNEFESMETLDNSEFDWRDGKFITSINGALDATTSNATTIFNYIPLRKGDTITCSKIGDTRFLQRICLYSKPLVSTFISCVNYSSANNNYVMPQDAYIRLSVREWSSQPFDYAVGKQAVAITRKVYKKCNREYNLLDNYIENATITSAVDGIRGSATHNLSRKIFVKPKAEYVLKGTYSGDSMVSSITSFNASGEIIERHTVTWTEGTYTHRFVFNSDVMFVRIAFPIVATNVTFKTYGEIDNITNIALQAEEKKYRYTFFNNELLTSQVLDVAMSYLGKTTIAYKQKDTPLSSDNYGTNIDCSTYIGLVLRGWECDQVFSEDAGAGEDSDSDMDETLVEGVPYWAGRKNTKYPWTMNPAVWSLRYNYTNTYPNDPSYEAVRKAAALGQWMVEIMGWEIDLNIGGLRQGDVLFFSRKNSSDKSWVAPTRFRRINHVAMFSHVDSNGKHVCIHVTGNIAGESPCKLFVLEDVTGIYVNGIDTLVGICRPNYSANSSYIKNLTPSQAGVPGNICYDNDYIYVCTSNGWKKVPLESI